MFKLDQRAPLGACERETMPYERKGAPILADEVVFHFDRAFTLAEVAKRLKISPRMVQAHIDDGDLVAVDVGRGDIRRILNQAAALAQHLVRDLHGLAWKSLPSTIVSSRLIKCARLSPQTA